MSMIGKLRQVSEFELAKYKKNPGEIVRALAGGPLHTDPAAYSQLRDALQKSPAAQRMMELVKSGQSPTREEQIELQKQMTELANQARGMLKDVLGKPPSSATITGRINRQRPRLAQVLALFAFHDDWKSGGQRRHSAGRRYFGRRGNWRRRSGHGIRRAQGPLTKAGSERGCGVGRVSD